MTRGKRFGPLPALDGPVTVAPHSPTCTRVRVDKTTYEQRYARCGKGCSRCSKSGENYDPQRPGHGPYWYQLVVKPNGQSGRRYIGKGLVGAKGPGRQPGSERRANDGE